MERREGYQSHSLELLLQKPLQTGFRFERRGFPQSRSSGAFLSGEPIPYALKGYARTN